MREMLNEISVLLDLLFDYLQFTIFCGLAIIVIFVLDYVIMRSI